MPSYPIFQGNGSVLTPGQAFVGTQNVTNTQSKDEAWRVHVRIQACDFDHGYLCGSMEALDVPNYQNGVPGGEESVLTFWEGEIIDNVNYFFLTQRWDANKTTDIEHWSKFECFSEMREAVQKDGGKSLDIKNSDYIFMRWKEKFFVNVGVDCGLTIAGFYYACFDRKTGQVDGFYYDPNSSPFQKLELRATTEGRQGYAFAEYSFA
eukprot:GFYU01005902.1.p1 GENE.GFYU01005902.1~~GFYU01005902.1.p1  ORF type:complete len:207 (+),score=36.51 GFYU01005902.1:386-1006(+)